MIAIEQIDASSRRDVRRFVDLPYRLYRGDARWVPPLRSDAAEMLNRRTHPFYERSDADFFVAVRDGLVVGRIAALENRPFNTAHGVREACYYCFECEDDDEAAATLFERAFEWAHARKLTRIVGPKGMSAFDGYGVLVEGFERRQMMTMTNYNPPRYVRMVEAAGFTKDVDFASFHLDANTYTMPEQVNRAAERARDEASLRAVRFASRRELVRAARAIGETYNKSFVDNWEYYPLSDREIDYLVAKLMVVADHRLITVVVSSGGSIVGFLLAFPDLSSALQRARGRLNPWRILDLQLESRRTTWVAINGAGILPENRGRGGNALLYSEIERTIRRSRFRHAELTQVAETAVQMRRDLVKLKAEPWKTHRVYARTL